MPESEYRTRMSEHINRAFMYDDKVLNDEILTQIVDTSFVLKKRMSVARRLRNYRYQKAVPVMIETILNKGDIEELRLTLLEALGWYGMNFRRPQIIKACNRILLDPDFSKEFKKRALSTKNRIEQGLNDPLIR